MGEGTVGAWSMEPTHAAVRGLVGLGRWDYYLSSRGVKNGRNWLWVRDSRGEWGKWEQTGLDDITADSWQPDSNRDSMRLGSITVSHIKLFHHFMARLFHTFALFKLLVHFPPRLWDDLTTYFSERLEHPLFPAKEGSLFPSKICHLRCAQSAISPSWGLQSFCAPLPPASPSLLMFIVSMSTLFL